MARSRGAMRAQLFHNVMRGGQGVALLWGQPLALIPNELSRELNISSCSSWRGVVWGVVQMQNELNAEMFAGVSNYRKQQHEAQCVSLPNPGGAFSIWTHPLLFHYFFFIFCDFPTLWLLCMSVNINMDPILMPRNGKVEPPYAPHGIWYLGDMRICEGK
jgi:hypothetical protein